jgi:hypothetical protein
MDCWLTHAMPENISFPELWFQISAISDWLSHLFSRIHLHRYASSSK